MEIKSYDPIKVNLNVDGRTITGYADSSMITIAQGEDLVTPTVGAQGDVVYSESANESGTMTISLQTTSASLPYLKDIAKQRKQVSVLLNDANSDTAEIVRSSRCRVTKVPDVKKEKAAGSVDITIFMPKIEYR